MLFGDMLLLHAGQVAEIHMQGQPGTLLTRLGKRFLTQMYAEVISSPWGFGVVALDGDTVASVAILTTSTGAMFDFIKRKRFLPMAWALLPQLLRRPGLVLDLFQAWRYPSKIGVGRAGTPAGRQDAKAGRKNTNDAEFLFLGARNEYRGQKITLQMFDQVLETCQRRGLGHVLALVDAGNTRLHELGTLRLGRCGWRKVREIEFHGRPMDVIEFDLSAGEKLANRAGT